MSYEQTDAYEGLDGDEEERYAVVGWSANDVMSCENCPESWSENDCRRFFNAVENSFKERLVEHGNNVLEDLLLLYIAEQKNGQR